MQSLGQAVPLPTTTTRTLSRDADALFAHPQSIDVSNLDQLVCTTCKACLLRGIVDYTSGPH